MLTRLQVKGFKNLLDVDVRFGPFTCIAGANGVGKSNLFDAVLLLSELVDKQFVEAVQQIRGGENPARLFSVRGSKRMELAAEMLIPEEGEDDFGQHARASTTFVRYEVHLVLEEIASGLKNHRLRLEWESLSYIPQSKARQSLPFPHKLSWRKSVVHSKRRTPLISTDSDAGTIRLHADRMLAPEKSKRGGGQPSVFPIANLPRTVLSSANNAEENRTAVLVRQEMRNWRLLQLEPSAMRTPDEFGDRDGMTIHGAHLPATLYRIAHQDPDQASRVYTEAANRLAELVDDVDTVRVDRDEKRQTLTLMMKDRHGLELPAGALSDGTLRFIALTVLLQDSRETGLLCLEEPENGIHPERIQAMLRLLYDIAVDSEEPVDEENPLRQIIVNTHSPLIAGRVGREDLLFAYPRSRRQHGRRVPELKLACLDNTWRSKLGTEVLPRGQVISYLTGIPPHLPLRTEPVLDSVEKSISGTPLRLFQHQGG